MASAVFSLADTPEARTELSLLLQIAPKQLDTHSGLITVEFPDLLEDKAMHVITSAVANHGFQPKTVSKEPETRGTPAPKKAVPEKGSK